MVARFEKNRMRARARGLLKRCPQSTMPQLENCDNPSNQIDWVFSQSLLFPVR
jgi:hypothetical protein